MRTLVLASRASAGRPPRASRLSATYVETKPAVATAAAREAVRAAARVRVKVVVARVEGTGR